MGGKMSIFEENLEIVKRVKGGTQWEIAVSQLLGYFAEIISPVESKQDLTGFIRQRNFEKKWVIGREIIQAHLRDFPSAQKFRLQLKDRATWLKEEELLKHLAQFAKGSRTKKHAQRCVEILKMQSKLEGKNGVSKENASTLH